MDNRNYNVFFNLHTVSGIVISIGLYVIFFAGAFTLFEHSIQRWEQNEPIATYTSTSRSIDYDRFMNALKKAKYDLYGRNIYLTLEEGSKQSFYLSGSTAPNASEAAQKEYTLVLDKETYEIASKPQGYSYGRLLYLLHFYYQLGRFGYYISGFVALFFLFATVTGIVIHWKKIISNFYVFRPKEKLKTVWTDAHTALGTIGIPFQFLYALTGAMFGLGVLAAMSGSVLYGGDPQKVYNEVFGAHADSLGPRTEMSAHSLNAYYEKGTNRWKDLNVKNIYIQHCESSTMQFGLRGSLSSKTKFLNNGEVIYGVISGKVEHEHDPYNVSYAEGVWASVYRLHYADYGDLGTLGNYLLRFLYFVMAVSTCFVIISGILIWLEARNKKNIPEKERRYNEWVGHIYLAVCLSMLPITAFVFIVAKLLPESMSAHREVIFNSLYFGGWLLLSIFFSWKRNNYFTNRQCLLWAGILGLAIPLVNGVYTGNWFWRSMAFQQYELFIIDTLWLFLSICCLYAVAKMKAPARVIHENVKRKVLIKVKAS